MAPRHKFLGPFALRAALRAFSLRESDGARLRPFRSLKPLPPNCCEFALHLGISFAPPVSRLSLATLEYALCRICFSRYVQKKKRVRNMFHWLQSKYPLCRICLTGYIQNTVLHCSIYGPRARRSAPLESKMVANMHPKPNIDGFPLKGVHCFSRCSSNQWF
jgi:hypothetical protein